MKRLGFFIVVGGALMFIFAAAPRFAWAQPGFCDMHDCSDWPAGWNKALDGDEGGTISGFRMIFLNKQGEEVVEQEET